MKNTKTNKIILTALMVVFLITPFSSYAVPSLDQQINQIDIKLRNEKAVLNNAKAETADAKNQLDQVNKELTATQVNISSLSKEISNKELEIKITEEKILKNKETLKELVRLLYEKGQPGTLEMLASTQSLTDLMNAEEYNRALEEKINTTIAENKALKAGLIDQKQQLSEKKAKLEEERQRQFAQQAVQKALYNEKYQQQVTVEKQVKISEQEKKRLLAQRNAQSRRIGGGTGGYPWANGDPNKLDYWRYYQRECVSYVAWYWNVVRGKYWGRVFGVNHGNTFDQAGRVLGYSVTSDPIIAGPGAIMVWNTGGYGHVAIVHKVIDRYTVEVSHYNYRWDHNYSYDEISVMSWNNFVY